MQNFRFSAVLDGGRASHQPDDPQLISYGSCGCSAAVCGISSVLQYRGIVKDAQNWLICTEKYLQNEESCAIISPS